MNRFLSSALVSAVAFGAVAALPASAGAATEPANADDSTFKYMAYEVETARGANAVYSRMQRSAVAACRSGRVGVAKRLSERACESKLLSDWVENSRDARLRALHRDDAS